MRDPQPIPEPRGALVPPRKVPPTAVGLLTPDPAPERFVPPGGGLGRGFRRLVERMLDLADEVASEVRRLVR